ncbi:unnamed protein product [Leuciscus chuanchicus]
MSDERTHMKNGVRFRKRNKPSVIHAWLDFGQSYVSKNHRQTVRHRRSGTKASATEIMAEKPQNIVDTSPYAPKGLSQRCVTRKYTVILFKATHKTGNVKFSLAEEAGLSLLRVTGWGRGQTKARQEPDAPSDGTTASQARMQR